MLGKKKFVSIVAMASCMGAVFAAGSAVAAVPGRAGSLRVQPGVTGSRSVSSSSVATPTVSSEPSRMATLAGMNNLGAKPKLPSGASAAAVADLQDKLSELSADVDALRNAGVDEGAVRDILDSELANKNYATVPYVDTADSAKLAKDEFESKFDTRADEKKLVDENAMKDYALGKNVSFSKNDTHIIMTDGNGVTRDVALLSDLKGDKGDRGEKGEDGSVDAAELERVVNEKIDEKDLPSKEFLSGNYVRQETYTADKETMGGKITTAQSAAENAGSKADAALLTAQNAQSAANGKLTKEQADEYYADKDFSYSKEEVDEKVRNASSGFDENRVSELITQAVDGAGFAKDADLTALGARVGTNETNISGLQTDKADKSSVYTKGEVDSAISGATSGLATDVDLAALAGRVGANETGIAGLQESKADKSDLGEYAKKSEVLSNDGTFSISDGKIVYTDPENGVVKDIVSVNDITGPAGNDGNDGADACEPQYTGTENADGDTDVVITCKEDSSKVLGRYTVKRGVNPCPGGISLEPVSTDASGATYNLVCEDGTAK